MKILICFTILISCVTISGCSTVTPKETTASSPNKHASSLKPDKDKVMVYVYRIANFRGGGRTHMLQIDGRTLGRLTGDNYFRLELWPGRYHLNVHLPKETFLGQTSPAMNTGYPMNLTPREVGKSFVYIYEDGQNIRRQEADNTLLAAMQQQRTMATALNVEETAHVKEFFDTRYEGPEMHGQPHGRGVLYWEDGSRYEGVFHYGQLTQEGKFYFPDGRIYMGRLDKGRPKGSGVLMSPSGDVLYAGPFKDEQPHGTGIRTTKEGPAYCNFEEGVDVTPSFFDLAEAAADQEERVEIKRFYTYWPSPEMTGADADYLELYNIVYQKLLEDLKESRKRREDAAYSELAKAHQARIDLERTWCEKEFGQDRKWCVCAPFDEKVREWEACVW